MEHLYSQQLKVQLNQVKTENLQLQSELKLHETSYKEVTTRLAKVQHELIKHKDKVASMEQLFQSQQAQLKQELQECKAQQEQATKLHKNQLDDVWEWAQMHDVH